MKKSISELGLLTPISVRETKDKKLEIIDGQHRFESLVILKLPIKYKILKNLVTEEQANGYLVTINNKRQPWRANDYINFFSVIILIQQPL